MFLYLDLCLPATKNSDAFGGLTFTQMRRHTRHGLLFSFSLLLFLFSPLPPPLLHLLALRCLLSLIFALGLTYDLSQERHQVSPIGTRRRTISIGIPEGSTLLDCT